MPGHPLDSGVRRHSPFASAGHSLPPAVRRSKSTPLLHDKSDDALPIQQRTTSASPTRTPNGTSPHSEVYSRSRKSASRDKSITLRTAAVDNATTRPRYDRSIALFTQWLGSYDMELEALVGDADKLDTVLVDYLQYLYDELKSKGEADAIISGLQDRHPRLRKQLLGSWRAAKAWGFLEPGEFRLPWPRELLHALVGMAVYRQDFAFAVFCLVSFERLSRPAEASLLTRSAVRLPSDFWALKNAWRF